MSYSEFLSVKLSFQEPLHLGSGKRDSLNETEVIIHSDTLKAALYSVLVQALPDFDEQMSAEKFFNGFSVSSCFPFANDRLLFPKPMSRIPISFKGEADLDARKKVKKIKYIEQSLFEKVLNGEAIETSLDNLAQGGSLLFNGSPSSVFSVSSVSRVKVNSHQQEDAVPFDIERIQFHTGAGLFFLLKTIDSGIEKTIQHGLALLAATGFGAERSVGYGKFSFTVVPIKIKVPDKAQHSVTLSLFCPEKDFIEKYPLSSASYTLLKRGGYISGSSVSQYRHYRKKSVHMFGEGSVFPAKELNGKIVDLNPMPEKMHPVLRDGNALYLPYLSPV